MSTINKIAENAYYKGINTASNITINVPEVNQLAFQNCSGITHVTIGPNVKKIDFNAFKGCTLISSFTVDKNNKVFKAGSSEGVCWLKHIVNDEEEELIWITPYKDNMGTSYNSVVNQLLAGNTNTKSTGRKIRRIPPYLFKGSEGIINLVIPPNITSIGYHAFEDCSYLYNILVENGRTETLVIEDYAFHNCGLYRTNEPCSITLGNSYTIIGNRALAFKYKKSDSDPGEDFTDIILTIPIINTPSDAPKVVKIHKNAFTPSDAIEETITGIRIVHTAGNVPELYQKNDNWRMLWDKIIFIDSPLIHTIEAGNGIKVTRIGDIVELDFDYIVFDGNEEATE